eukprot:761649-Hanusia_phi.AAC.3
MGYSWESAGVMVWRWGGWKLGREFFKRGWGEGSVNQTRWQTGGSWACIVQNLKEQGGGGGGDGGRREARGGRGGRMGGGRGGKNRQGGGKDLRVLYQRVEQDEKH